MTQTTNNIVLTTVSAKALLDNTKSLQVDFCLPINMLSNTAIDSLLSQPVICSIPNKKLGKSRMIENEEEAVAMIQKIVSILPNTQLEFLRSLPVNKLENTSLNLVFVTDLNSKVITHLHNMFFIQTYKYKKEGLKNKNGKIDYLKLEKSFTTALGKGEKIKDYLKSSRRYSYAAFLSINARTFTSGGKK